MPSDYLLKIEGVNGESNQKGYEKWLELESWSWGESQTGSFGTGGGGGAGKVSMQDFHFTTRLSTATPDLFFKCANGAHIPKVELHCRKAGGKDIPQKFLTLELNDVLVSSYQTGASSGGDPIPTEQFSMNFAKIKIEYFKQDEKGATKSAGVASWDLKKGVKA